MELKNKIEAAFADRSLLKDANYSAAVHAVIEEVDKGRLRVAEPIDGKWVVNEWVKQAILLYFGIQPMQTWELAPFEFHDKMLLKSNYAALGVRAVPHAVARYGAYLAKNVVLMPSYVNIGAFVDEGTMVDTWATVGSCAQIGKGVHFDKDYKIVTQYGGGSMIKPGSYDRYVVFKNNPEADFNCIAWPMGLLQVSCNPFKEKKLKEIDLGEIAKEVLAKHESILKRFYVSLESYLFYKVLKKLY